MARVRTSAPAPSLLPTDSPAPVPPPPPAPPANPAVEPIGIVGRAIAALVSVGKDEKYAKDMVSRALGQGGREFRSVSDIIDRCYSIMPEDPDKVQAMSAARAADNGASADRSEAVRENLEGINQPPGLVDTPGAVLGSTSNTLVPDETLAGSEDAAEHYESEPSAGDDPGPTVDEGTEPDAALSIPAEDLAFADERSEDLEDRLLRIRDASRIVANRREQLAAIDEQMRELKEERKEVEAAYNLAIEEQQKVIAAECEDMTEVRPLIDAIEKKGKPEPVADPSRVNKVNPLPLPERKAPKAEAGGEEFDPAEEIGKPGNASAIPADGSHRPVILSTIKGLTEGMIKGFSEVGIVTLGDLQDFQAKHGDRWAGQIKGMGPAKQEKLSDALGRFWDSHIPSKDEAASPAPAPSVPNEPVAEFSDEGEPEVIASGPAPESIVSADEAMAQDAEDEARAAEIVDEQTSLEPSTVEPPIGKTEDDRPTPWRAVTLKSEFTAPSEVPIVEALAKQGVRSVGQIADFLAGTNELGPNRLELYGLDGNPWPQGNTPNTDTLATMLDVFTQDRKKTEPDIAEAFTDERLGFTQVQ